MKKVPFTPLGVQTFLATLYAFTDEELLLELSGISDFAQWMKAHFLLTEAQENYLDRISPEISAYLSAVTRSSLTDRLPVNLIQAKETGGDVPEKDDDGKLLDLSKKSEATILNNRLSKSESLSITISYLN